MDNTKLSKEEFDKKLLIDFPKLYKRMNSSAEESCLAFGIEHNSGWFDIIYKLSQKINDYAEKNNMNPEVEQVKQKFGELRFYIDNANEVIYKLIDEAEYECSKTCEVCGSKESVSSNRYITICDKCK